MRKASDMTSDMLRACALRCPIRLANGNGKVRIAVDTGDWFAHPAKTEATKRYRKAAVKDLTDRQLGLKLNTDDFHGEFGRVRIGGKMFSLFPKSQMLVRDDFAAWCERHLEEVWDVRLHRERLPERDTSGKEVDDADVKAGFAEARRLAMNMPNVTDLMEPGSYNTLFDMRRTMAEYNGAITAAERTGRFFPGTHILMSQLAATIAYRERKYADAVKFSLRIAALGLKLADHFRDVAKREAGK